LKVNSKVDFMVKSEEKNQTKIITPPSFIKLAMRNMVRKGSKSLSHFLVTFLFLISFLILIATLGKPNIPLN
tara:strand:+ start:1613 stop:1828 length:216 start_codon:yes stop_codon:yes gene_type:complete